MVASAERIRPFNHIGFNAYLVEHRLMGVRCTCCDSIFLPPRELCPNCYNAEMEWMQMSGVGELIGFSAIHIGLPAMIAAGYNRERPYCSGIVRLSEGPTISGLIVGENDSCPEEIAVGLRLQAAFVGLSPDGQVVLAFEKAMTL